MDSYAHLILEAEKNNNLQKGNSIELENSNTYFSVATGTGTTTVTDGKPHPDNGLISLYSGTSEQAKEELREILNDSLTYSSSYGDWINRKETSYLNSEHPIHDCMVNPSQSETTQSENVNHPSHYNTGKIEVIDFIEDQNLGFHLGNAIKYICRAGKKDKEKTKEDLEKAVWYIKRYVEKLN